MTDTSSDDTPAVPIVCSDCETETRVPVTELADTLERHNDQMHDGADVAQVDPDIADQVADLVAEDMGLLDE